MNSIFCARKLRFALLAVLTGALLSACGGPGPPQSRPYEILIEARDTNGDAVSEVQILDAAGSATIAKTDTYGQARLGVLGLPGSAVAFRARPPADYQLGEQDERRSELLRPGPSQETIVQHHELVLRPLKLNYVLLVDSEVAYSEVFINEVRIGMLNSQGAAAFLYSGVPETQIMVRVSLPEQLKQSEQKRTGYKRKTSSEVPRLTNLALSSAEPLKLTDQMSSRILYFHSELKAPVIKPLPHKHRPVHRIIDISANK